MGQAKQKNAMWLTGKAGRFVRLLVFISRYSMYESIKFAKRRFTNSNERRKRNENNN
jgi:hypothetical protein